MDLKNIFRYDKNTGIIYNRVTRQGVRKGSIAGSLDKSTGYIRVFYRGKRIQGHQLAFYLVKGYFPKCIDHIDGKRSNNKWCNLREVTKQENCKNTKRLSTNKSGTTGVSLDKVNNKWRSRITVDGKIKDLGRFLRKEDAITARREAEVKYDYHPNHGRD